MAQFYIDFECWLIEAEDEHQATEKAVEKIKKGERPKITNVEWARD